LERSKRRGVFSMQKRLIGLVIIMLVGAASAAAAVTLPRNTARPTINGTADDVRLPVASV
jgi:hypothetical protein